MPHEFAEDTLRDIKLRDIENLKAVFAEKGKKNFTFERMDVALAFVGQRIKDVMEKLGVNIARMSSQDRNDTDYLDSWMQANNITIENRTYDPARVDPDITHMEEDFWRGGIYIYKDNEIVSFIGVPVFVKDHYNVMTTGKV
jgi:hypothetical protein